MTVSTRKISEKKRVWGLAERGAEAFFPAFHATRLNQREGSKRRDKVRRDAHPSERNKNEITQGGNSVGPRGKNMGKKRRNTGRAGGGILPRKKLARDTDEKGKQRHLPKNRNM